MSLVLHGGPGGPVCRVPLPRPTLRMCYVERLGRLRAYWGGWRKFRVKITLQLVFKKNECVVLGR